MFPPYYYLLWFSKFSVHGVLASFFGSQSFQFRLLRSANICSRAGRVRAPGAEHPDGPDERQPEQRHHRPQQQQLRQQPAGYADAGSEAARRAAGARAAQEQRPVGEQA